jgi:hypothetical protein
MNEFIQKSHFGKKRSLIVEKNSLPLATTKEKT